MVEATITNASCTYIHDDRGPLQAIDTHHVIVRRNAAMRLIANLSGPLLVANPVILLLTKDKSTTILLWSLLVVALLIKLLFLKPVEKESVVIMPTFGVQLETHYGRALSNSYWSKFLQELEVSFAMALGLKVQLLSRLCFGRKIRQFIPMSKILKPVLNECVTPVTCYWSLSLIVRGEEELMLVFKELRPPVRMLVPIWKALCAAVDTRENAGSSTLDDE